ncbi:MAG: hypothetical protein JO053_14575 [Acidobacteria bacterium]|nr:hypothetical protein [Acidobacteriota bacterium]
MNGEETSVSKTFVEGRDFYFENGLMVLTGTYLLERGYCCGNQCRHCPYGPPYSKNTSISSEGSEISE